MLRQFCIVCQLSNVSQEWLTFCWGKVRSTTELKLNYVQASIFGNPKSMMRRGFEECRETREETIYRKERETTVLFSLKCLQVSPAFTQTSQELRISDFSITLLVLCPSCSLSLPLSLSQHCFCLSLQSKMVRCSNVSLLPPIAIV